METVVGDTIEDADEDAEDNESTASSSSSTTTVNRPTPTPTTVVHIASVVIHNITLTAPLPISQVDHAQRSGIAHQAADLRDG
jgi:hypothetical protein